MKEKQSTNRAGQCTVSRQEYAERKRARDNGEVPDIYLNGIDAAFSKAGIS